MVESFFVFFVSPSIRIMGGHYLFLLIDHKKALIYLIHCVNAAK